MNQAVVVDSRPKSSNRNFVAINYIRCKKEYRPRFEELFGTRAHAIDRMPGFVDMHVLRPQTDDGDYLIVSFWETEETFKAWTQSPEFLEGHKRGFEDIRRAKERGEDPPMKSDFKTYEVIAR
jgi:heme-degrading monooxygenase HmoA